MSAQHYVSKFHVNEFCDLNSLCTLSPWTWIGDLTNGSVKRRSPKNVGTSPDLFAGPGGLKGSSVTMEDFLANEVEGPASIALREFCSSVNAGEQALPPAALMRYLAWAASRSLPMQRLEMEWAKRYRGLLATEPIEAPPISPADSIDRHRPVRLLDPNTGETTLKDSDNVTDLLDAGWIPDPTDRSNFLEGIHVQVDYFQDRWFPRLRWFTLRPQSGDFFIIGDRPVGWGVPDCLDAPPCCLRDPSAFLIAPLSRDVALVGRNDTSPWSVRSPHVNALLAAWSHKWIAGPTEACVTSAIRDRSRLLPI
jgi:hypothetical protein